MLIVLAVASLVLGNLAAIAQSNLKRMLAYSTIAQMGFVLLGMLAGVVGGDDAGVVNAYSAAMFYVMTYALTTMGTFGIMLLLARAGIRGRGDRRSARPEPTLPWYAFVMLLLMFSLAGVPPTVGFYAKLVVLQALLGDSCRARCWRSRSSRCCFRSSAPYYYLRVVKVMYFDEPPAGAPAPIVATMDMRVALSVNGVLILALGILPQYLLKLCADAMIRTLGG